MRQLKYAYDNVFQVFLVRKVVGKDSGTLYAMKVLKKATLKGIKSFLITFYLSIIFPA